jgi:trypsin
MPPEGLGTKHPLLKNGEANNLGAKFGPRFGSLTGPVGLNYHSFATGPAGFLKYLFANEVIMKNTAMIITVFASLIGTASVSFGDTSCAKNLTVKSGLSKLPTLKNYYVTSVNGAVRHLENDPRQVLDRNQHQEYNPIGTVTYNIDSTKASRASGWLGNECLVWTAKHVIGSDQKIIGKKVKFSVGQTQSTDKNFEYEVEGEVVASGNPDAKKADFGSQDWALIKLKKSVGKQVGFIETAQYSVADATTCKALEVAGYPAEKTIKNLWWQGNCGLNTNDSGAASMSVSCPVTPGNSGGPLLCREADGKLYAIGIMNQQVPSDKTGMAVNFTADWANAKAAFQKYKDTCN